MPWQEKSAERLRMEFIVAHESEQYSFTELCELFGISREAGCRCIKRFTKDGIEGLKNRSRAPRSLRIETTAFLTASIAGRLERRGTPQPLR